MKKMIIVAALAAVAFMACRQAESETVLIKTDQAFSAMSVEKGALQAFHSYMAENGKVLPFEGEPRTKKAYADLIRKTKDLPRSTSMIWEPTESHISASGDLGVTYGKYESRDEHGVSRGYYLTVWKKQPDGSWKFIYDTANKTEE